MLTKNQTEILNLFRKNSLLKTNILQIKKNLKKSSYQRVYDAVKELERRKILIVEKIGNASWVSLQLTRQTIIELSFLDEQEALSKDIPNYDKIINLKEISDYLIIVTGSYAKGTQNKKSDLDLVIIVPDKENVVNIKGIAENLTMLYLPEVHLYVFKRKDFIDMLNEKGDNYGKEIYQHHLILKNAHQYYELIKEVVEYGFKG